MAHQHRIKPAAAPLAACHGAKLMPPLTQTLTIGIKQLRRERAFTHAGGIGLDDAQDEINRRRAKAHAGGGLPRDNIGGGHIGIGAKINVQQRPLRAFEQNPLARTPRIRQHLPDRPSIRLDLRRNLQNLRLQRHRIHRLKPQARAQRIVMGQKPPNSGVQCCLVEDIGHPNGAPTHLVLIGRTNAAPRGANLSHPSLRLTAPVQLAMNRQDQAGVLGQNQIFGANIHALAAQLVDLGDQMPRIHHHTIANDRQLAAAHDATGQQAQLVNLAINDQRMARIVTALKARDDIGALAEPVYDLSLPLVPPLGSDDDDIGHGISLRFGKTEVPIAVRRGQRNSKMAARRDDAALYHTGHQ